MHKRALTKEQVFARWRNSGMTATQWAKNHGYDYMAVIRVLNGQSKASRGLGHEIAVKLGMKVVQQGEAA